MKVTALNRTAYRIGAVCLLLSLGVWGLSLPLHCAGRAALVGGWALLDGGLLGLALALVTRARRPLLIYLFLGLAALTFWPIWEGWPLYRGWPVGDPGRIVAWRGAPELVYSYFDLLRSALFLLGMPAPFVRYGQHGPDPLPPMQSRAEPAEKSSAPRGPAEPAEVLVGSQAETAEKAATAAVETRET
jgi:hypothetical protein